MISIIIPAHNEECVIARCLQAFVPDIRQGEAEVIVVCNGCTDRTAEVARTFDAPVRVVETDVASKANALNLGDTHATSFPRLYLDADVSMDMGSIRALAGAFAAADVLAAAPRVETVFSRDTDLAVRWFYKFWLALPYIQEGMITAGAYALSEAGRARFSRFPDILADDGFVRLHYSPSERVEVQTATSIVSAPSRVDDLVKIRTRSRLGVHQLRRLFPDLFTSEQRGARYWEAFTHIAKRPNLYFPAIPYLAISALSWLRARRQIETIERYVWERDASSRR